MQIHAIHKLYQYRLSKATKPFRARGANVDRCKFCLIARHLCICDEKVTLDTNAAFMLVMYDDEVLKPSNTGRLIADTVKDTSGFIWSRTEPDPKMLEILNHPDWQPYVVFPSQYAEPERVVSAPKTEQGKRPLFILIDGTWQEAKKIFRKSQWLAHFPVLSIQSSDVSRYKVRTANGENQLATAEVAARVLDLNGESKASTCLDAWFDVFREHYLAGKRQKPLPVQGALSSFRRLSSIDFDLSCE
ncbi:tRNA-uridine aminocarboxypropyltransferase [Veronia pacifica]|uniref:tRNA-uridine aminocarboxypropyltransferase n=1 Tax=Veronia pacifica TaxID=1080227 RepID=A0A1C3ECG6_9GAMM|nr:tRNA-uridine aminocarboxypropyltransferase [Veronia pacifica]ODA30946.1 DTW domain-containing protein [Veronia pacifica]